MESTANVPKQAQISGATALETLPSEIKVMILGCMPNVSSLRSILHASPTYNQAYLRAREEILHNITIQTLQKNNIGLLDPWTAIHAPQLNHRSPHRVEMITEYLERYAQGRMDGSRRRLAPQDSLAILSLHRKFTILIATYCNNMIAKNPLTGAADDEALPPSQSELHRLHRALWRYGIYSKIFGSSKESSSHDSSMTGMDGVVGTDAPHNPHYTFSEDEIAHEFFGLFPIHEVEELACLQKYARDYYQSLVWDGDQLVALGPKQLYEVMTATSEDERELRIAEGRKAERVNVTMRAALDAYERVVSWGSWPWKGLYDKFVSERVPTTGWLWASSRGVQITDYRLRRWGYVFWDQERLHGWGITQEHMVHWPDPRGTSGVLVRQG